MNYKTVIIIQNKAGPLEEYKQVRPDRAQADRNQFLDEDEPLPLFSAQAQAGNSVSHSGTAGLFPDISRERAWRRLSTETTQAGRAKW